MQFKMNYRLLHMYVNKACIINERHTHLKISVGTVQLGEETWVNQGTDVQISTHGGAACLE